MGKVFLVSCVAKKEAEPMPAAMLYTSTWFAKARSLVLATGQPWFILSAEYGLLSPNALTAPYERTLNRMSISERRRWAQSVRKQMDEFLPMADEVIIFAGLRYRENIMQYLQERYAKVSIPMEGLGIGRQLNWLDNATL